MYQRVSLYWQLSELSPVSIANEKGTPVAGPFFWALTACTIASATCAESISWGRYDEDSSPGVSNRSSHSTRAGDWWSTMWMSLNWTNAWRPTRRPVRPACAATPRSVRTWRTSPGPATILE